MSEAPAVLNPEPADPQERAEHDLPPKSYADAAQEAVEPSPIENGHDHENSNGVKKNGDVQKSAAIAVNAGTKDPDKRIVFERYSNGNGSVLTSVRTDPNYEEFLKHDRKVAPRKAAESSKPQSKRQDIPKSQLKSGRKAGEGWQQSAYVKITTGLNTALLTSPGFAGLLSMFLFNDESRPWLSSGTPPRSLYSFPSSFSLPRFHYAGHYSFRT